MLHRKHHLPQHGGAGRTGHRSLSASCPSTTTLSARCNVFSFYRLPLYPTLTTQPQPMPCQPRELPIRSGMIPSLILSPIRYQECSYGRT